jgi:exopolysaccharide biosynthesis polyprenyl glycosylphosphotransferase
MLRKFEGIVALLFVVDLFLTEVALYLSDVARRCIPLGKTIDPTRTFLNPYIYLLIALIWPLLFRALGVYDVKRAPSLREELKTLMVAVPTTVFVFAGSLYLSFRDVSRLLVLYFFILDLAFLASLRLLVGGILRTLQAQGRFLSRVLIVGANEMGATVAGTLDSHLGLGFTWQGFVDDEEAPGLPILGKIADIAEIVTQHDIDEVIIALPSAAYQTVEQVVYELQELPVRIRIVPDFLKLAVLRSSVESLAGIPLIGVREPVIDGLDWLAKRTFDVVVSTVSLLFSWPLMLLIALAIKLDSPGPMIFKQQRVGENGRFFWMYKFRTMVCGAEGTQCAVAVKREDGKTIYKIRDDPRVTRVGRILRRTSLDELPQLFNVLKGEMSLVGPRPEQVFIVEQYEPFQRKRLSVPPGITGWWQISGRSDLPMHLNTQYDLFYIRNYSLLLDLKILWKTVGAVIRGKGAY